MHTAELHKVVCAVIAYPVTDMTEHITEIPHCFTVMAGYKEGLKHPFIFMNEHISELQISFNIMTKHVSEFP